MAELDAQTMYTEYAKPVYSYLLGLCRDPSLAEELTSETFYQAIKSIARFDGSCKLKTWLFQIAKHVWYHESAKRGRTAPDPAILETLTDPFSMEESLEDKEQRVTLYKRIHALDEPYRSVVYLRLASGLSFEDIGAVLGKTGNWVRVTYYRAKERLLQDEN